MSAEDSTDEILALLESQNDGLNTDEWRIKERKIINLLHVELIFTVDGASMDTIKKCEFLLDYKLGTAPLRRKLPPKHKTPDNSDESVDKSSDNLKPAEQHTALSGVGENKQTKIPTEHLKDTGDSARGNKSNPNLNRPGTSGIGSTGNLGYPKISKEPRCVDVGSENTSQESSGPKALLGSKRYAKNSPINHGPTKTVLDNKDSVHKNKYISKYIKSLGNHETNIGGLKSPQESETSKNNASEK